MSNQNNKQETDAPASEWSDLLDPIKMKHEALMHLIVALWHIYKEKGFSAMKESMKKTSLKYILDIVDDGSLPEETMQGCVLGVMKVAFNNSAKALGCRTI